MIQNVERLHDADEFIQALDQLGLVVDCSGRRWKYAYSGCTVNGLPLWGRMEQIHVALRRAGYRYQRGDLFRALMVKVEKERQGVC